MSSKMISKTSKFILVEENEMERFNELLMNNNQIVPCSIYLNKEDGRIYFVERKGIDNNIESI